MSTGSNNNQKLLNPHELASLLNVSKDTVYRYVEKRSIPFYRFAGNLRFNKEEITEYLKKHHVEPVKKIAI